MKRWKYSIASLVLTVFTALSVAPVSSAAGSASFSLAPGSASTPKDGTLEVTLNVTSTDPVNVVEASMAYDSSKLQFLSISFSGTAFSQPVDNGTGGGGGTVNVARGAGSPLTGTNKVATISFKALVSSGSTNITFNDSSLIASNGNDVWNHSATGGTYSFTAASQPAGGNTGGTNNAGNNSGGSNNYGTPSTVTDEPVETASPASTSSYIVNILVKENETPIADAEVTLNETTIKSDATGIASFIGIPAGEYKVKVKAASFEKEVDITVETADPNVPQEFVVQSTKDTGSSKDRMKLFAIIGLVLLAVAAIAVVIFQNIRRGGASSGDGGATTPVIGDMTAPADVPANKTSSNGAPDTVISPTSPENKQ